MQPSAGRPCVNCLLGRLGKCRNCPTPSPSPPTPPLPDLIVKPEIPIDALPSLDSTLSLQTPTLHHIPKGARDAWALLVGEVLSSLIASPSQSEAWRKLFMLARCILASPPRGGWRDSLRLVLTRIQKWRDGRVSELLADVGAEDKRLKARLVGHSSSDLSPDSLRRNNAIRACSAVGDGQYRKALQSLTSAGLAQPSQDVLHEMLHKQLPSNSSALPADPPPPPVQVTAAEVSRALKSFPNGSAPGPSGLWASHLKQAVFVPPLTEPTMLYSPS